MKGLILAAATAAAILPAGAALAGCALERFAELPVTMDGLRATVPAEINGAKAQFIVDTGAFYSTMSAASATQFGLPMTVAPWLVTTVKGIGGQADVGLTRVKRFTLGGAVVPNVEFLVGGTDFGFAGLLGQNVWSIGDVEYDFAGGAVRFFNATGCAGHALAYWDISHRWSVIDMAPSTAVLPFINGSASVNGVKVRVLFDSGAPESFLTLRAARRVGLDVKGAALAPAGQMGGVGKGLVQSWTTPVASFKIGGEEIRNTRLRVADSLVDDRDMLIGADFFLSHRLLVASSQGKIYFTYNGGPVFRLDGPPAAAPPTPTPAQQVQPAAVAASGADAEAAAAAARRGAAFTARRQFTQAIFELTRACKLAPGEAEYPYQRALAYLGAGQSALALADLDEAVRLRPDEPRFLLTRADVRLVQKDKARALADLRSADANLAKTADARLELGQLFERSADPASALAQYDLWLASHPEDGERPLALGGRCWARAFIGADLDKALADCTASLTARPGVAAILAGRALVLLRMGAPDQAIADDDKALAADPRLGWALYGRGLARSRMGDGDGGKADIAAALAVEPGLGEVARDHGLTP